MSVKAMGLVWDLECPKMYGDTEFRPTHKFTLLAYADHADHHGKNIWPAVVTIAKKTGLDDRTVQRLTRDLVAIGLLIDDGQGPKGTRRWKMPYDDKGWRCATPAENQGGNGDKSLGDIPLGDIPLSDTAPPEFKEPEPNQFNISNKYVLIWGNAKNILQDEMPRASFDTWVRDSFAIHFDADQSILWIATRNDYARDWMVNRLTARTQKITGLYIRFMTIAENELSEIVTSD